VLPSNLRGYVVGWSKPPFSKLSLPGKRGVVAGVYADMSTRKRGRCDLCMRHHALAYGSFEPLLATTFRCCDVTGAQFICTGSF
jgi:hypothetical protein